MSDVIHETTANSLQKSYLQVRNFTDQIVGPLTAEDCMVQSMDDVSPTRWHIAHTTWFFETFVLKQNPGYQEFDPQFNYLFNSYYNSIGKQFPRPQRGFISRPGLDQIKEYRSFVDNSMTELLAGGDLDENTARVIEVGLHHEQQHQELILTDIKHVMSCNPTLPHYHSLPLDTESKSGDIWIDVAEGMHEIGHDNDRFCFDNELPCHQAFLNPCQISNDLVTCGQYIEFMEAGGYQHPQYWLALGWSTACEQGWDAPMYWTKIDDQWHIFTLAGLQPVNPEWPVCHVSYFEADAFARWSGKRLPTEFEWEVASRKLDDSSDRGGQFADDLLSRNKAIHPTDSTRALFGGVWQWTSSSYSAYPGYQPPAGAIGEYNGKFMCNQYVLRGGSVATSKDHIRRTYRNFFPPQSRWQFFGIRLARS